MNVRKALCTAIVVSTVAVTIVVGAGDASARVTLHEGYVTDTTAPPGFVDGEFGPYHTCADKIVGRAGNQANVSPDEYVPPSPPVSQGTRTYLVYRQDQLTGGEWDSLADQSIGYVRVDPVLGEVVVPPITRVTTPPLMSLPTVETWDPWLVSFGTSFEIALPPGITAGTELALKPLYSRIPRTLLVVDCQPRTVTARIDVLPGLATNFVVPSSPLPVPVDIFGSADFDAAAATDLRLAGAAPVVWPRFPSLDLRRDLNRDGYMDRRVWFVPRKMALSCRSTSVAFTAKTPAGAAVTGSDSVRPVLCR